MAKGFTKKSASGLNKAVSNSHGQFRAKAEKAGMSTRAYARKEEHAGGKVGKQARLAETLMGMNHGGKKKDAGHTDTLKHKPGKVSTVKTDRGEFGFRNHRG